MCVGYRLTELIQIKCLKNNFLNKMSDDNKTDNKNNSVNINNIEQKKTYAILQETSGEEKESWLYFIRYEGNEEALKHLQSQLEKVEWRFEDDTEELSAFDLELDYLVSETTAKDMIRVDLNHTSFHRKFDGKLEKIDLEFNDKHSNTKKMLKAFKKLGYGKIDEYVTDEEVAPSTNTDNKSNDTDSDSDDSEESDSDSEETDSDDSEESEESNNENNKPKKKKGTLPKAIEIPRFAKAKQKKRKNKNE